MFLPKISKKFTAAVLLTAFLSLIFPFGVFAQNSSPQSPNPNGSQTVPSYKIIPIPPPSSGNQITPIPQPDQNYQIQQAFLGPIDDIFNGALDAFNNFVG